MVCMSFWFLSITFSLYQRSSVRCLSALYLGSERFAFLFHLFFFFFILFSITLEYSCTGFFLVVFFFFVCNSRLMRCSNKMMKCFPFYFHQKIILCCWSVGFFFVFLFRRTFIFIVRFSFGMIGWKRSRLCAQKNLWSSISNKAWHAPVRIRMNRI